MDDVQKEMVKGMRATWESYVKTLTMMQEQGEKMLEMLSSQTEAVQKETKELAKEWVANAKEAQNTCFQAMEENLKKIEDALSGKKE